MGLDGRRLDDELGGDLGVGQATREQPQHVVLAGGQPGQGRRLMGRPGELLDQPAGADGREKRVTGMHGPDGGDQLGRRRGLEQEPGSAGPERIHDVVIEVECRQHHHAGRGELRKQPPGGLDPVQHRHADVHQHEVGPGPERALDGLAPVGCLGDDLDIGLGVEDEPEAAAHERLVVGEQDADHADAGVPSGSRARTVNPSRSARAASSSPPSMATRSRIPTSPCPLPGPPGCPEPVSATSSSTDPPR